MWVIIHKPCFDGGEEGGMELREDGLTKLFGDAWGKCKCDVCPNVDAMSELH